MSSELTNLLPEESIRAFRREYFFHLGVVAAAAVLVLVLIHAALLFPSYLYLRDVIAVDSAHLAELNANLASSGEGEMQARLVRLQKNASDLLEFSKTPGATPVIRAVLAVPRQGITVSAFTFHAPSPDGRMTITGVAATRESLRQYALALSSLSFAKSADLPLSAYAKESDIPFTITLTGPLTP